MWLFQVAVLRLIVQYCWPLSLIEQPIFCFGKMMKKGVKLFLSTSSLQQCLIQEDWISYYNHKVKFTLQSCSHAPVTGLHTIILKYLHVLGTMQDSPLRCFAVFVLACLDMLALASATTLKKKKNTPISGWRNAQIGCLYACLTVLFFSCLHLGQQFAAHLVTERPVFTKWMYCTLLVSSNQVHCIMGSYA